jgi:hypothetical protein
MATGRRVGLNYKPNPDTLLFVSWNRGIKGGNWTLSADVTPANFRHDPERLNSFEGGVKWSNADRTLRANLTAYHYIYDNYQAFSVLGGLPQVSNSDARATGTELEVFWQPVKRLNVNLGATWETTKVKQILGPGSQIGPEFFPGAPDAQYCANQGDGTFLCTYPQKAITDAKLPNAPKFSINYLLRYNIDAFGGNLAAQFDGVVRRPVSGSHQRRFLAAEGLQRLERVADLDHRQRPPVGPGVRAQRVRQGLPRLYAQPRHSRHDVGLCQARHVWGERDGALVTPDMRATPGRVFRSGAACRPPRTTGRFAILAIRASAQKELILSIMLRCNCGLRSIAFSGRAIAFVS